MFLKTRLAAILIAAIAVLCVAGCRDGDGESSGTSTTTETVTQTTTETSTAAASTAQDRAMYRAGGTPGNGVFVVCDGHSGIGTTVTSCPFAINVAHAYSAGHASRLSSVYSPTTGRMYDMECHGGATVTITGSDRKEAAVCRGGRGAVVLIF